MSPLRRPRPLLWSLAFTASLLLALLPAAGRLHRAFDAEASAPAMQAFCSAQGLVLRGPMSSLADETGRLPGKGAPAGETGDDCAYCPLLATTGLPALASPVLPPLPPMATVFAPQDSRRTGDRHPIGQGARGPPARFAA
jgi:hypothetical protein